MRGVLIVMSEPVAGEDATYNEWYDGVHLPEVLAVPGFRAARRFVAEPSVHGELPPVPYMAIYEIEGDDLGAVQANLSAAARQMQISASLNRATTITYTYRLISELERDHERDR
jgi:hypothetical protein